MSYRIVIRDGPNVEHYRSENVDEALAIVTNRAQKIAEQSRHEAVNLRYKTYTPISRVIGRAEICHSEHRLKKICAGVDVRGDGSMEAWRGRFNRKLIDPEGGDLNPLQTLEQFFKTSL